MPLKQDSVKMGQCQFLLKMTIRYCICNCIFVKWVHSWWCCEWLICMTGETVVTWSSLQKVTAGIMILQSATGGAL